MTKSVQFIDDPALEFFRIIFTLSIGSEPRMAYCQQDNGLTREEAKMSRIFRLTVKRSDF